MYIFDRQLLAKRRSKAALTLPSHDFLFREVAERLSERLEDTTRRFPVGLDLGCRGGIMRETLGVRGGVEQWFFSDLSPAMRPLKGSFVVADEEFLPFKDESFDIVVSLLNLHAVNDLPGALIQIQRILKKKGLFLACLFGGKTLYELREALLQSSLESSRGVAARVSPFADVKDAGALLQRAGFDSPVSDSDVITVSYGGAEGLFRDLKGMGESNILAKRPPHLMSSREYAEISATYHRLFQDEEGRIPATFEILTLTGWKM